MSEFEKIAKGFASQLGENLKAKLEGEWDAIPEVHKAEVQEVLKDWSALTLRAIGGEPVERELSFTKATMQDWKFVGASKLVRALQETLKDAAVFASKIILGLVV